MSDGYRFCSHSRLADPSANFQLPASDSKFQTIFLFFAKKTDSSNMEKHLLSKSTFIKGYHCLKSLYLHKNRPFLRDKLTAEQRAKFKRGHEVGDLAQQLFPGGVDVSPKSPSQYQKSVLRTEELIANGQEIIYEATFQHEKVLVMLDLLVKKEDGWHAYEVKSSKKLSETYFTDAALQYWVIVNSGLDLHSFSLVYVDEHYRLNKDLDLHSYFIFQNVTEDIKGRQAFIGEKIAEEKTILLEKHSPKIAVGDHCFSPYKCDFVGFCWKKITDKPYVAKEIDLSGISCDISKDAAFVSLIFTEQAIPKCENEKAYSPQILGFKIGDSDAQLLTNTCDTKKQLAASFFKQVESSSQIIVFNKTLLQNYLEEVSTLYPDLQESAQAALKKTVGLIDLLVHEQKIAIENRSLYSAALLSKTYFKDECQLHELPIYSDILARELYDKTKVDLWIENHPDLDSLKTYLSELQKLTQMFAHSF